MATYASLTAEEKELVAQAERFIRGFLKQLATGDLDLKMQWYTDNVLPIINSLDAGAVIPNSSGLAGSTDLTKENLAALRTWVNGISGDIETNKSLLVKAIGVNA